MATADEESGGRSLLGEGEKLALTAGPGSLWLVFLLLAPLTFMIAVSFVSVNQAYEIVWQPTLANYDQLFSGGNIVIYRAKLFGTELFVYKGTPFEKSLWLSYIIAAVTTVLCLTLAFPLAYLLARVDGRRFKLIIFFVLLPFFTMYLVRAYSWLLMFGQKGVLNTALVKLTPIDESIGVLDYGIPAIIVGLTHAYFPYMLLSLYASLDGIDFSLVEAARDLGASRIEVLNDVILPLALPGIISGGLFVFVPALGAFITPNFLGQGKVLMVGQLIELEVKTGYNIGFGSAGSMFIVLTIVVGFLLAFRYVTVEDLGGV